MDLLYPQPLDSDATTQQLAKQLAEPLPFDFDPEQDHLEAWRGLHAPWTDWSFTKSYCRILAGRLMDQMVG